MAMSASLPDCMGAPWRGCVEVPAWTVIGRPMVRTTPRAAINPKRTVFIVGPVMVEATTGNPAVGLPVPVEC